MKCYYPIDSAGNRIGFKTPEACVYDASGTSLTTKLAQINSNISNRFTTKSGKISSNNTACSTAYISYTCMNKIVFINVSGQYTLTANQLVQLYTLPYNFLYPSFGFNQIIGTMNGINVYFESYGDQYLRVISNTTVANLQIYGVFSYISTNSAS